MEEEAEGNVRVRGAGGVEAEGEPLLCADAGPLPGKPRLLASSCLLLRLWVPQPVFSTWAVWEEFPLYPLEADLGCPQMLRIGMGTDRVERSPQGAFSTCSRLRHASPLPHILPREYTVAE